MRGGIYQVRTEEGKVVNAICLIDSKEPMLFAKIRTAKDEEIRYAPRVQKKPRQNEQIKKGKKKPLPLSVMRRRAASMKALYIAKPNGLSNKAVVLVMRQLRPKRSDIIRKIADTPIGTVEACFEVLQHIKRVKELQEEINRLERRISFAQMNNESTENYEYKIKQLRSEAGIRNKKEKGSPVSSGSYRKAPTDGYIKIYLGGR